MSTRSVTITIASGASTSEAFTLLPHERLVAVVTPGTWTAADIGFQVSVPDGSSYLNVVDGARPAATSFARISNVDTGSAQYYVVPEALDMPLGANMKTTSINTINNTVVNQGADRILTVIVIKTF